MIELKDVTKKYDRTCGINNISFNIKENSITGILGTNESGKSTLLKMIVDLIKLDEGTILIDGQAHSSKSYDKISFVPQEDAFFEYVTIKESFNFMKAFYKNWDDEKAYNMLTFFSLKDNMKIENLSKIDKQKLKIIYGFAQNPKYILIDEPFRGIDVFKRKEITKSITSFISENQSIVIATNEIYDIYEILEEVIVLDKGNIVKNFNVKEIQEKENKNIIKKLEEG